MMSGPHALIKNVLATQQPFLQAATGTWHFRQNNAPLEAQPNESDDLAEPAEHIDDVNIFFFINYLLEYMTTYANVTLGMSAKIASPACF